MVSSFIVQALLNRDITIFGEGLQTRSFCYVDDLICGLLKMMESGTGPLNLGNPQEFTMLELAQLILKMTDSRSKIVHRPLPEDDPRQRRPDISEAQTPPQLVSDRFTRTRAEKDDWVFRETPCRLEVERTL